MSTLPQQQRLSQLLLILPTELRHGVHGGPRDSSRYPLGHLLLHHRCLQGTKTIVAIRKMSLTMRGMVFAPKNPNFSDFLHSISILDPRRFTPTLHANLVSEILALRRDQEEKGKHIEALEIELHETRGEHEQYESELVNTAKENRSLKRQLALLEGGTSSAVQCRTA